MNEIESLRSFIRDALNKHMYDSASIVAEKLARNSSNINDIVLFADCYFHSGQYRRCIGVLEQSGILNAQILSEISKSIQSFDMINNTEQLEQLSAKLNAINLGAKCLLLLKEYEDCIVLLDTVLIPSFIPQNKPNNISNTIVQNNTYEMSTPDVIINHTVLDTIKYIQELYSDTDINIISSKY